MKRVIFLLALLSAISSAQARLGETVSQLVKRFGSNYECSGDGVCTFWLKQYAVLVQLGELIQTPKHQQVSVFEVYISTTPLVQGEPPNDIVRGILNTNSPKDKWHEVQRIFGADYAMQNKGASLTALLRYSEYDLRRNGLWVLEIGITSAVFDSNQNRDAAPDVQPAPRQVQPAPMPQRTPRGDNDCGIVAMEAYARLKSTSPWCQVVAVRYIEAGNEYGHAVVAFKYQADGHVFIYDVSGSFELDTDAEVLEAIKLSWQRRINAIGSGQKLTSIRPLTH
jgi:hypothetical protein